jgi:hypothetical protein
VIENNLTLGQSIVRKLGPEVQVAGDRIMTIILALISASSKASSVLEDAFLVVGALAASAYSLPRLLQKLTSP